MVRPAAQVTAIHDGASFTVIHFPMLETISHPQVCQMLQSAVGQIRTHHEMLSRLDAAVGDGDHGTTILRTMDAVGADTLFLLDGGVELYHPSVVRSSMGTLFWKPAVQTTFGDFIQWARGQNIQLIGTSAHGDVEYHTLVPQPPWALVLGNEQKGLAREQMDACDVTVSLPMQGRVSSLNLSVAAGVLLYQFNK